MFWGVVLFRAPRAVFCAKFRIGPKPQNFHSPLPARGFPVRSNEAFPYLLTAYFHCVRRCYVSIGEMHCSVRRAAKEDALVKGFNETRSIAT